MLRSARVVPQRRPRAALLSALSVPTRGGENVVDALDLLAKPPFNQGKDGCSIGLEPFSAPVFGGPPPGTGQCAIQASPVNQGERRDPGGARRSRRGTGRGLQRDLEAGWWTRVPGRWVWRAGSRPTR